LAEPERRTGVAWFITLGVPAMADRPLSIDIKHPLLIKNADLFLIADQDGSVPQAPPGFGLFYRDCCYLSRYEFSLNGTRPLLLMSAWDEGFAADIELTNAILKTSNGTPIHTHMLGIKRKHLLIEEECAFIDVITFEISAAMTWNSRSP
jgi:glycogen debranching enzyme